MATVFHCGVGSDGEKHKKVHISTITMNISRTHQPTEPIDKQNPLTNRTHQPTETIDQQNISINKTIVQQNLSINRTCTSTQLIDKQNLLANQNPSINITH
ncbi:hypothetical protein E3U43_010709 [Larimichthys crocea]|uniref:Uncharacterized protein n=1 Tax=Larimichthys crocea TaxID=215358 RepID=A0ACD3RID3_LARCR|nr:hypothetical protein E3U43_010709 [Larimichthys crocea]